MIHGRGPYQYGYWSSVKKIPYNFCSLLPEFKTQFATISVVFRDKPIKNYINV